MEFCSIVDNLPNHLKQFIVDQNYEAYTAVDHAVWRYVMGQNVRFLSKVAHGSYLDGLKRTGISLERIPSIYGMNRILKDIGWAAVTVDGFIPPNAFMEFQKYKVLVIAADIRQLKHIEYTPAPDIIHEAAGHAPIIADEEYAEYLKLFGEIGSKSFSSSVDYELYEAIRELSILKEYPNSTPEEIKAVEDKISQIQSGMTQLSEMAQIRNLHWWTVEYGLIGTLDNPKIYGAGLLSSIGESYNCLKEKVKKLPYDISAANQSFDITEEQPQLFVTPDFAHLTNVLNEFADKMALRNGGVDGAKKAVDCSYRSTLVYDSGLQVSGAFEKYLQANGELTFIKTTGPTTLSYNYNVLDGHGWSNHAHGFSSPVGLIEGFSGSPANLSPSDLESLGLHVGKECKLNYTSGFKVKGILESVLRNKEGKLMLLSFSNATATYKGDTMFLPDWGMFDVAIGSKVISAFQGEADPNAFEPEIVVPKTKTLKVNYNDYQKSLQTLFAQIRKYREEGENAKAYTTIYEKAKIEFPEEWLLFIELFEVLHKKDAHYATEVLDHLTSLKLKQPQLAKLIEDGIEGIGENFVYSYAQ